MKKTFKVYTEIIVAADWLAIREQRQHDKRLSMIYFNDQSDIAFYLLYHLDSSYNQRAAAVTQQSCNQINFFLSYANLLA